MKKKNVYMEAVRQLIPAEEQDIILLVESGSMIYGWNTPHSDRDARGIYVKPLKKILGLTPGRDAVVVEKEDMDVQLFEIHKFLSLLLKGNFSMMEWVYSPICYYKDEEIYKELCRIAELCKSKTIGHHARGWSYSIHRMDWTNPKKCLMALRPLMVYIHLLNTGEWESNIRKLQESFDQKLQTTISMLLEQRELGRKTPRTLIDRTQHEAERLKALSKKLEEHTPLPDKPDPKARDAADELLYMVRMTWHHTKKEEGG